MIPSNKNTNKSFSNYFQSQNYKIITFIETRFGDPISSLNLNSIFLIIGTMLGRLYIYNFKSNSKTILCDTSDEEISNIHFLSSLSFHFTVGDEKICTYKYSNLLLTPEPQLKEIRNYPDEYSHINKCDFTYTIINKNKMLQIKISQPETHPIVLSNIMNSYIIKDLNNNTTCQRGEIEMTTYVVPFDFNGNYFAWVDFLNDKQRNLCLYNFQTSKLWKLRFERSFGHISHCKFLKGEKIFIVRNLNLCEIRSIDDNFTILYKFNNIGDCVIAIDIYYNFTYKEKYDDDNYLHINKINKNSNHFNVDSNYEVQIENEDNNELSIFLLDIEGNINLIHDNEIINITNIPKINGIKNEYIKKGLFSLGYPYYLKFSNGFFAVSSDFGCYVFSP